MKQEVREHIVKAMQADESWKSEDGQQEDSNIRSFLEDHKNIHDELGDEHRWYYDRRRIVEIGGRLLEFWDFVSLGDIDNSDLEIDLDSYPIFVKAVEKQITVTEYVEE